MKRCVLVFLKINLIVIFLLCPFLQSNCSEFVSVEKKHVRTDSSCEERLSSELSGSIDSWLDREIEGIVNGDKAVGRNRRLSRMMQCVEKDLNFVFIPKWFGSKALRGYALESIRTKYPESSSRPVGDVMRSYVSRTRNWAESMSILKRTGMSPDKNYMKRELAKEIASAQKQNRR